MLALGRATPKGRKEGRCVRESSVKPHVYHCCQCSCLGARQSGRSTDGTAAGAPGRPEAWATSRIAGTRFHAARSERTVADAGVADGTQGSHARVLPIGRLVSVLQDAAGGASDANGGPWEERYRARGRQLRRRAHPRRLFEAPWHYVSALVGS